MFDVFVVMRFRAAASLHVFRSSAGWDRLLGGVATRTWEVKQGWIASATHRDIILYRVRLVR